MPAVRLPDPIISADNGPASYVSRNFTPNFMLSLLRQAPGNESHLTRLLQDVPQNMRDKPYSDPKLSLAFASRLYLELNRPALEMSILGQWKSDYHFNQSEIVALNQAINGYPKSDPEELSQRMISSYIKAGLLTKDDLILDVGSGRGAAVAALLRFGFNVLGIEPDFRSTVTQHLDNRAAFILALKLQAYAIQNQGKKFTKVMFCNFYPISNDTAPDGQLNKSAVKPLAQVASYMTDKNGMGLFGINSGNPQFIAPGCNLNIKKDLESAYEKVTYMSASKFPEEFKQFFSVGGQMGVYICTGPKQKVLPEFLKNWRG